MDYIKMKIETSREGLELLSAILLDIGITGFEIEDPEEFKEFLNNDSNNWDYIEESLLTKKEEVPSIAFYLPTNNQGKKWETEIEKQLDILRKESLVNYGTLQIFTQIVKEEDWAHTWKQYFKPFTVGQKLFVRPSWEEVKTPEGRISLEIDPETSFGTGQHHTTKMCLELLEALLTKEETVLDMGCGSGILSTAALLLGAKSVLGVDIEENSMVISEKNMKRNGVREASYQFICGDILTDRETEEKVREQKYDMIVANIVSDVIIAQSKIYNSLIKQTGTLIVSGVIDTRKEEVKKALENSGFCEVKTLETKGWVAMVLKKGAKEIA